MAWPEVPAAVFGVIEIPRLAGEDPQAATAAGTEAGGDEGFDLSAPSLVGCSVTP